MIRDRRGVSETVGFVLVFSLVLLTVGTVFTVGYGGLQDVRDAERVNNAERAFDVLADNLEDITARGAPSRGTEIRLAEASIGTGTPTLLNVSGYENDSTAFTPINYSMDPVVYEADGTRIRYAAGAVTRVQADGSALLREPGFVLSDRRVILPIVELSVADREIAGSRTVLVRAERYSREIDVDRSGMDRLELDITSPAAGAWKRYAEAQGMNCSSPDDGQISCATEDLDRVQIVEFTIRVTFG